MPLAQISKSYFVALNGESRGPFLYEQVSEMLASGEIKPDDLIWTEGLENWVAIGVYPDFSMREDSNVSVFSLAQDSLIKPPPDPGSRPPQDQTMVSEVAFGEVLVSSEPVEDNKPDGLVDKENHLLSVSQLKIEDIPMPKFEKPAPRPTRIEIIGDQAASGEQNQDEILMAMSATQKRAVRENLAEESFSFKAFLGGAVVTAGQGYFFSTVMVLALACAMSFLFLLYFKKVPPSAGIFVTHFLLAITWPAIKEKLDESGGPTDNFIFKLVLVAGAMAGYFWIANNFKEFAQPYLLQIKPAVISEPAELPAEPPPPDLGTVWDQVKKSQEQGK